MITAFILIIIAFMVLDIDTKPKKVVIVEPVEEPEVKRPWGSVKYLEDI